ncbi:unnamed protein product [Enterobius vermicularis]|uniref:D-lactate dehydratase n=1 Tax=Enterobius vermicularis TaxID=51028 RepID=A0A0N4VHL6_ENTVE|nr:unnamed protein product [Enterobius vermicularis]
MAPKTALVILSGGAEEMETVITVDVLRRGGIEVTLAGLTGKAPVTCSRKIVIEPEVALSDVATKLYDVVVLPGGLQGSEALATSPEVGKILHTHYEKQSIVAAICAAPKALKTHSIAPGCLVTSHPCVKDLLIDAGYKYTEEKVAVSGKVVTSRGPGTTFDFALKLVELLVGPEKVKEVVGPMMWSHET